MIHQTSGMALLLFLLFAGLVLGISFYLGRRAKSVHGYFAAGGAIPWAVNGVAFAGDYLSAASFLGICGMIAFFGYGIDRVDRGDVAPNPDPMKDPRVSNQMYFGNVFYSLNARIQLALEVMHMRTTYKSVAAGDDWREQFALILKF